MRKYEYTGETPLILAGVALGGLTGPDDPDRVELNRVEHLDVDGQVIEFTDADGTSPVLFPGDELTVPDGHEAIIHALLFSEEPEPTVEPKPEPKQRRTRRPSQEEQ